MCSVRQNFQTQRTWESAALDRAAATMGHDASTDFQAGRTDCHSNREVPHLGEEAEGRTGKGKNINSGDTPAIPRLAKYGDNTDTPRGGGQKMNYEYPPPTLHVQEHLHSSTSESLNQPKSNGDEKTVLKIENSHHPHRVFLHFIFSLMTSGTSDETTTNENLDTGVTAHEG